MTDLDALVARLRDYAKCDFVHAGYWRCTPPTVDAGGDCEEAADALLALRTARGDFERAELARATASAERDAAQADTARLDKALAVLAKYLEVRTRERNRRKTERQKAKKRTADR